MQTNPHRRYLALFSVAAILALASLVAVAQTNQLTVSPGEIFRHGDTRDMDCKVQLNFTGSLPSKASAITDIRIHRAVDDKGKDLTKRPVNFSRLSVSPLAKLPRRIPVESGWQAALDLKCPGASAKTIQQIKGEIDLAFPTKENGGLLKVTNFMANPGQVIDEASLAKHRIKLTFHTFESYVDFHRAHPKQYVDSTELAIERSCFSGIYGSPTNPPRTSVAIQVEDPNKLLLGLGFETGDGRQIRETATSSLPDFRGYRFQQPLPQDVNLVVTVKSPGVVRTEPFALVNIQLPWNRLAKSKTKPPASAR